MDRIFTIALHVTGTMTADLDARWTAPCDCQLIHVSAVNTAAYAAGLSIGTSVSGTAYLAKCDTGVSSVPVEKTRTDFVGDQYPHVPDGTIVVVGVDYNYNGGGAAQSSADLTVVLTFTEG
ncbi:MAG TPA: hypothetical protein VMX14_13450 [Anaerolineae bacterium]|nr:hypothetical protein [Anaerolineae bacterium]